IDDDANQTGQMLAALWDRPQATFASKVELADGKATVAREVDAGLETSEGELPAELTSDLRLNEPRFVQLPEIMQAKRKPLETMSLEELGVERAGGIEAVAYEPPPQRGGGKKVESVDELVSELKSKGLL